MATTFPIVWLPPSPSALVFDQIQIAILIAHKKIGFRFNPVRL
ncbi:hypothetical protein [Sansalvadorimonas verongulae]|nr:hypothetical protein [Sansalvadorimonas verongulae]